MPQKAKLLIGSIKKSSSNATMCASLMGGGGKARQMNWDSVRIVSFQTKVPQKPKHLLYPSIGNDNEISVLLHLGLPWWFFLSMLCCWDDNQTCFLWIKIRNRFFESTAWTTSAKKMTPPSSLIFIVYFHHDQSACWCVHCHNSTIIKWRRDDAHQQLPKMWEYFYFEIGSVG